MGNFLGRKKKEVTEELEGLSAQMKFFRTDIESTFERRKAVLWHLSLIIFFLTTAATAYVLYQFPKREHQIVFSVGSILAGIAILVLMRRLVNKFFDYRVTKKQRHLDEILEKKKKILEDVKENETFKKAKEILEKYDDDVQPEYRSQSQPATPLPTRSGPPQKNNEPSLARAPQPEQVPVRPLVTPGPGIGPTPMRNIQGRPGVQPPRGPPAGMTPMMPGATPMGPPRPRAMPPRPFVRESKSAVDKVVDYFFGDGPNQRYALICCNCHSHNGMAFPGEYEYLAFMCFVCGQFNPAKKLRPGMQRPSLAAGELPIQKASQNPDVRKTGDEPTTSSDDQIVKVGSASTSDDEIARTSSEKSGEPSEEDDFEAIDKESVTEQ